jgi:hypothetical protein
MIRLPLERGGSLFLGVRTGTVSRRQVTNSDRLLPPNVPVELIPDVLGDRLAYSEQDNRVFLGSRCLIDLNVRSLTIEVDEAVTSKSCL